MNDPQWLALIILVVLNLLAAAYSYGSLNQQMRNLKDQVIGQRDDLKEHSKKIEETCTRVTALEIKVEYLTVVQGRGEEKHNE